MEESQESRPAGEEEKEKLEMKRDQVGWCYSSGIH
jgi:hypothetical protein